MTLSRILLSGLVFAVAGCEPARHVPLLPPALSTADSTAQADSAREALFARLRAVLDDREAARETFARHIGEARAGSIEQCRLVRTGPSCRAQYFAYSTVAPGQDSLVAAGRRLDAVDREVERVSSNVHREYPPPPPPCEPWPSPELVLINGRCTLKPFKY